jgi:hypothetical protein
MHLRDKRPCHLLGRKAPLLVDWRECLHKGKDESIAETTEQTQAEDDGLAKEHLELR